MMNDQEIAKGKEKVLIEKILGKMEVDKDKEEAAIDLLHPELFSEEGIIELLKERHFPAESLLNKKKQDLIDIFYDYVVPRPQRKYRSNRRGREMTKKQIIMAKRKRKHSETSYSTFDAKSTDTSRLMTSFTQPPVNNRLKPPPSQIDLKKKVIKLGGTKKIGSPTSPPSVTKHLVNSNKTDTVQDKGTTETCVNNGNKEINRLKVINLKQAKSPLSQCSDKISQILLNDRTKHEKEPTLGEIVKKEASDKTEVIVKKIDKSATLVKVVPKQVQPTKKIKLKRHSFSPVSSPTTELSKQKPNCNTTSPTHTCTSEPMDTQESESVVKKKLKISDITWP